MTVLYELSKSFVRVLLLTILLETFCTSDLGAAGPAVEHPVKTRGEAPPPFVLDAQGLPSGRLGYLLRSGQIAQIRSVLAHTPRHDGDEDARRMWLAACLSVEKDYEKSAAEFSTVKQWDKAPAVVLCVAAQSYAQVQDFARAIKLSTQAIGLGYGHPGYEIRGGCYNVQKRYIEAAEDYQKEAKCHPRVASDFYCRAATAMLSANKPLQALALCDKAPQAVRGVGTVAVLLTKGVCYERLSRWSDGVTVLTEAIAMAREGLSKRENASTLVLINSLVERAKCYEKLGKKAEAAADRRWQEQLSRGVENDLLGKDR